MSGITVHTENHGKFPYPSAILYDHDAQGRLNILDGTDSYLATFDAGSWSIVEFEEGEDD
jgi:hypothetical protein